MAKVAADVPRAQVLRMLQALLAERFQLRLHRETRELRVYRMTIARGGHKLKPPSIQDGSFTFNPGRFIATGQSMTDLADKLTRPFSGLDTPVIDATGLEGAFDFTLTWAPDGMPSIFDALQEQLGLKLEAGKSNVEVLVIDHAERVPVEN